MAVDAVHVSSSWCHKRRVHFGPFERWHQSPKAIMITPVFSLSQDDSYVYLVVKAAHARVAETEVDIECDNQVKFFSHPYFLR